MISKDALKPFIILAIGMMIAGIHFWTTSRYPDLSGKSMVGTNAPISSIGFSPLITVDESMPFWKRVLAETVNWMHTNKKGMTFSFIFGTFFLSLWPLIRFRAFKSGLANSALGTIMGAPLGVCVNCAAPIARSVHAAGASLQTTLSALVASPTLNVVVLLMAFSVFPFYMAALKLGLTLAFVLIVVPLACHLLFKEESVTQNTQEFCEIKLKTNNQVPEGISWIGAMFWCVKAYAKNFFYLLKIALPLMILAGFLGALLTVLVPWSAIETLSNQDNIAIIIALITAVSFFGALLPSPMAFDVVVSAALLQAGVPVAYVAAFLFTLGSFSIYAFFIIWQAVSFRVASFMMLATMALGVIAGLASIPFEKQVLGRSQKELIELIKNENHDPIFARHDEQKSFEKIKGKLDRQKIQYQPTDIKHEKVTIQKAAFQPKSKGKTPFTFKKGADYGIMQPYTISYLTGPSGAVVFSTMSIASGDVHNDGWPDLLIMGDHEVRPNLVLYANMGGKEFTRQEIPVPEDITEVILVSLADLNADGWLDIVFATLGGQNFVIYNNQGAFNPENVKPLLPKIDGTTMSISYGDIEGDGNLDVFLGNWSVGPHFINYSRSKNTLLKQNSQGDFDVHDVPGPSGETLTSMFADFNDDGLQDVYVGNDYIWGDKSDFVVIGTPDGLLKEGGEKINKTLLGAQSTMSIDSADIDNDLEQEYYIAHIAYAGQYMQKMSKIAEKQIAYKDYCIGHSDKETCEKEMTLKLALARGSNFIADACDILDSEEDKKKCLLHIFMNTRCGYNRYASNEVEQKQLEGVQPSKRYSLMCDYQDEAMKQKKEREKAGTQNFSLIKVSNPSLNNILLKKENNGFVDQANERKIGFGAWTWNARWADLDNDGFQDLYIVNGYSMPMALPTNIFYRNNGAASFEDKTQNFGLESYTPTSAFTYLDMDNDGDLDIITVPTDSDLEVFQNHSANNAVQFELYDTTSKNTQAIGAKITITYTLEGQTRKQMQIIKASGGYKSYNQPIAHFGLLQSEEITSVQIDWPNSETTLIKTPLASNMKYRIEKKD